MGLLHEMLGLKPHIPIITDGSKGALAFEKMRERGTIHADDLAETDPDWVRDVHKRYIDAGSNVIQTFTFQLNSRTRHALTREELSQRNRNAVGLAKDAVGGRNILVAASIGPLLGEMIAKPGKIAKGFYPFRNAVSAYSDQMQASIEGGVDVLNVETLNDPRSVEAALLASRRVQKNRQPHVPLVITMNFDQNRPKIGWSTSYGTTPKNLVQYTNCFEDVVAVGANCGSGFDQAGSLTESLIDAAPTRAIIWMKMNAGKPELQTGDVTVYSHADAGHARSYATEVFNAGARAIGGCCGTTPELIKTMHEELVLSNAR